MLVPVTLAEMEAPVKYHQTVRVSFACVVLGIVAITARQSLTPADPILVSMEDFVLDRSLVTVAAVLKATMEDTASVRLTDLMNCLT